MEINFSKLEEKILKFWRENKIFEKSIEQRKKAPNFVFYEGPPTANAAPGIHHVLARVYKDIICRYRTMQGFKVLRKAGWDTHGLPVELEIEKKLGLKSKKDIEKYGIASFNKLCKESVWHYKKDWEKLTERIGYWLELENPYITYTPDYIETVWWILKKIYQKGLLYQDYKVVPYCYRCGTSLSSHEVALGYEKIKEPAIYIKFRILNPEFKNTSLLVWTTTPWTLPGNVAIAVNSKFEYVKVKVGGEFLILAKERIGTCGTGGEIVKEFKEDKSSSHPFAIAREFKGKDLVGLRYEPLYPLNEEVIKRAYRVIPADFVSLEEGTGLVHIAPAFGEEDMTAGKKNNFPILLTVDEEGRFTLEVKKWARMFVKDADPLIIEDLKNRNLLFKEELYEHDYPFCWRCHSPLLYYAKQSWFINMQKVKRDLIKNNRKINWTPAHLKKGRFGEWLEEIKDWALSRERFWGTPLPIWRCQKCPDSRAKLATGLPRSELRSTSGCQNLEVIGSKEDLISQKFSTNQYYILRHGETIYQTEKKKMMYPWPESEPILLTENGKAQIKKIAKKLKGKRIDLIYSSDISRTRQTAEIVARELGVKLFLDKRLRDINLGIYHGELKEKLYRAFPNIIERFSKKPKKGESWLDCRKRMIRFLEDIDRKYQNKKILVIGHGDPLWLLEGAMKGISNEELVKQKLQRKTIKTGELRKIEFGLLPYNEKMELDFHRPYIDNVKFFCKKCDGLMERVPEVIDCWFDSGSMPFAQGHWPFAWPQNKKLKIKNKKLRPPELFPADYISEAVDQTRGWFYTLLAISTLLGFGTPYKNVISLGHVLDEKGEKMSKSKGNVVNPWQVVENYGADATRWYFYTINQPGDAKLFSEKDVDQALKKFILTFWNCFQFFETYTKYPISNIQYPISNIHSSLDRWIISRLNKLVLEVTEKLDKYDITGAARAIENFVINDLSLWYIRRSRRRFQKPESKKELKEASENLGFVLLTLSKLTAPFIPFLSEEIHQNFQQYHRLVCGTVRKQTLDFKLSVHLEDWPKVNKKLIDKKLEKKMKKIREVVTLALAQRAKARIKVRQPLKKLKIKNKKLKINDELINLIKDEVNVKEVVFDPKIEGEVELDTEITPELKEEGIVREVIRNIQEMRKQAGLKPRDKILVKYLGDPEINRILAKNENFILKEAKIKSLIFGEKSLKEVFDFEKQTKVDNQNLWLAIKKN
jgi:isoleucyl-tRNA synthetase